MHVLLIIPIIGIFLISTVDSFYPATSILSNNTSSVIKDKERSSTEENVFVYTAPNEIKQGIEKEDFKDKKEDFLFNVSYYKKIALLTTLLNLIVSLVIYMLFDFSNNQFQFIQENLDLSFYDVYLGVDGISIYFVLLTTIIMPIALVSNWNSIINNVKSYLIIMLLLETLLLAVFLVLDVLLFYIFFESILPPAWISGKYSLSWDKLSNSGEPLKLKVPNYILKNICGWINHSCMVIILKMRENKMGNRGSKSVVNKNTTVKEQRVYGSCIGNFKASFPMLRCTLQGFEKNCPVRIPSNHLSSLRLYSTVTSGVANSQTGSYTLKPYFVTGFTDAEGSFIVRIRKNPKAKVGWSVETKFSLCLHKKDKMVLDLIQSFFGGVGSITYASKDTLHYRIASLHDLIHVVLPHFDKYPLNSQKRADYLLFKKIVLLIKNKEHLTIEGIQKIVNIRASINLGSSENLNEAFPNTVPVERPIIEDITINDPYWFAGFASGEACFTVNIYKSKTKLGEAVQLKFDLAQHSRDSKLLTRLQNWLGFGSVNRHSQNAVMFTTTKFTDFTEYLIPFFDKYQIIGVKYKDYQDLKKVAQLMEKKAHLTIEGLEKIRIIKAKMNRGRSQYNEEEGCFMK